MYLFDALCGMIGAIPIFLTYLALAGKGWMSKERDLLSALHAAYENSHMISLINVLSECYKNISTQ